MAEPPAAPTTPTARRTHWDERYETVGSGSVSWFEPDARTSLAVLDRIGVAPGCSVIDVGGGASHLVDGLVGRGFTDVTVLDVSAAALAESRGRVGDGRGATWLEADLLAWEPERRWDVWHDRAVFHFLTEPADRAAYRERLAAAVEPGGLVVVATFAPDGPEWCSGLPVRRYDAAALHGALGEDLALVASERTEHTTPSGAVQPFTWVVLRRPVTA